jgi:hypothetical protein
MGNALKDMKVPVVFIVPLDMLMLEIMNVKNAHYIKILFQD